MTRMTSPKKDMDKTSLRKIKKCEVEKRRRIRMEQSLEFIKKTVITSYNKNPSDYDKMEKADILDMAVDYLVKVTRDQTIRRSRDAQMKAMKNAAVRQSSLRVEVARGQQSGPTGYRIGDYRRHASGNGLLMVAPAAYQNALAAYKQTMPSTMAPEQNIQKVGGNMWRPW